MNNKFDELTKGLAQFATRRGALKKFGLGFAGAAFAWLSTVTHCFAQGTAFSYQGNLTDGCCPATGFYDMTFKVFDNPNPGVSGQVGTTVTTNRVPVTNGLFGVTLDFGGGPFNGARRWLQMEVRTNNSQLTPVTLLPRTEFTPTPYSVFAGNAGSLNGLSSVAFAPASGSVSYVTRSGDTMTGRLSLPANGLSVGANQLVVSNGNVGIGIPSPQSRLDINGGVRARGGSPGSFGANNNGYAFTGSGDNDSGMFSSADGQLEFYNNANEGMRLVNGSLGVGTTTPSERLHIGGNVRYDGQLSKLDVGDSFQATVRAADFLFGNSSRHGSPGRALVDFTDTLVFNFGPDWTNTVINGNVALDWNGRNDGNLNFGLRFGGPGSGEGIASRRTPGANQSGLDFYTAFANRMSIRQDGRVGVGTLNPTTAFEVVGTVRATSFQGDGSALSGITATTLDGLTSAGFWKTGGNSGTMPGTQFLGTADNQPLEFRVNNARVLRLEPTTDTPNFVGGYAGNSVAAGLVGVTIHGGTVINNGPNSVNNNANYGTISGGYHHLLGGYAAAIGGGAIHTASGDLATIAGGIYNSALGSYSTVGGGIQNYSRNEGTTVSGGQSNFADAAYATIPGGQNNRVKGPYCTIGGGSNNFSGETFFVRRGATVGGGIDNAATGNFATVGGGSQNQSFGSYTTTGGGLQNSCGGPRGAIGGGLRNTITSVVDDGAIGGGSDNLIQGYIGGSTLAGGLNNSIIGPDTPPGPPGGGGIPFFGAAIGGGGGNRVSLARYATIGGGSANTVGGDFGTVPGGSQNLVAGAYSFAAGRRAQANHDGCFVWADSQDVDYGTTGANQFKIRASGGFRVDGPGHFTSDVFVDGRLYAVVLPPSDRNAKTNFGAVDSRDVLKRLASIPVQTWNYKQDMNTRHIGPMAQDFYAAYNVGLDDKHIATVDADGVALAAIQGLYEIVKEKDAEIQNLKERMGKLEAEQTELDRLNDRITALEKLLTARTKETRSQP